jgi:hypothetical protein
VFWEEALLDVISQLELGLRDTFLCGQDDLSDPRSPVAELTELRSQCCIESIGIGQGLRPLKVHLTALVQNLLVGLNGDNLTNEEVVCAQGKLVGYTALQGDGALGNERRTDLAGRSR